MSAGHQLQPLGKTGLVWCVLCGACGWRGNACRGHRSLMQGSLVLAVRQLMHDWRGNPKGFEKHFGS